MSGIDDLAVRSLADLRLLVEFEQEEGRHAEAEKLLVEWGLYRDPAQWRSYPADATRKLLDDWNAIAVRAKPRLEAADREYWARREREQAEERERIAREAEAAARERERTPDRDPVRTATGPTTSGGSSTPAVGRFKGTREERARQVADELVKVGRYERHSGQASKHRWLSIGVKASREYRVAIVTPDGFGAPQVRWWPRGCSSSADHIPLTLAALPASSDPDADLWAIVVRPVLTDRDLGYEACLEVHALDGGLDSEIHVLLEPYRTTP